MMREESWIFYTLSNVRRFQKISGMLWSIEGRIRQLEHIIRNAVIMDILHKPRNVCFGSHVKVYNEAGKIEQFTIVGPFETSPRTGKISYESPLGRALLGKSVGDTIVVATPLGPAKYVIEDIF